MKAEAKAMPRKSCQAGKLAIAVAAGWCSLAAAQGTSRSNPPDAGIEQKLGEQVPLDLTFIDEAGQPATLRELVDDKPVVLALVYYKCPMLCGQVLNGLLESLRELRLDAGREFNVLTISIDPEETPALAAAKKKGYLARYNRSGSETGWRFLTGEPDHISQIADAVGFRYTYDPKTRQYAHAAGIMVLTPEGRIARYFYGIRYNPRDLRLGLVEASSGTIGSPVDALLLLCYSYDPAHGRYGLVIANVLRVAGGVTILLLAALIFFLSRKGKRPVSQSALPQHDALALRERADE
jgi:protein SCO1/2